jgi:hypothetical protein
MGFVSRIMPPLALILLSPLIAEYLLGDIVVTNLMALLPLGLMYGGGALLIREVVRRMGRGWLTFVLLGAAYGIFEEGLVDQSLFNPNYLHLRLLDYGFLPALGTAFPWAIYVVGIHVAWSMAVPIGLTESLFALRRSRPWLSRLALTIPVLMLLGGAAMIYGYSQRTTTFHATPAQLGVSAGLAVLLVALALGPRPRRTPTSAASRPGPLSAGITCFVLGYAFMSAYAFSARLGWPWPAAVTAEAALAAAALGFVAWRAETGRWGALDAWGASAGAMLVYAWNGYGVDRALNGGKDFIGHSVLVAALILLQALAGFRAARAGAIPPRTAADPGRAPASAA